MKISPAIQEESFRIGGQVTDPANKPLAGAIVMLVERGLTTKTNDSGRYSLGVISSGVYTLRIRVGTAEPQDFSITIPAPAGSNYNGTIV